MQPKRPVDSRIGARLAEARQARGLSQGKLARRIGVATGTVQAYEHGRCCRIAVERLEDIADALHCDAADLLKPARPHRRPA
jgi:transcriptional regulator with XRE-family HTH domain